jgi:hypothetical protein
MEAARSACLELEQIAAGYEAGMLAAAALNAKRAMDLAQGDPEPALVLLRRASQSWQELTLATKPLAHDARSRRRASAGRR